jgi:hypothetical protein
MLKYLLRNRGGLAYHPETFARNPHPAIALPSCQTRRVFPARLGAFFKRTESKNEQQKPPPSVMTDYLNQQLK